MISRRDFGLGAIGAAAAVLATGRAGAQTAGAGGAAVVAVDTHTHVFKRGLKLADVRRYAPDYDATPEDLLKVFDANKISHGVVIQPSFLGTDNSYLLEALRQNPERLRGVVVVDPATVTPAEIDAMNDAGAVGLRLNLVGLSDPALDDEPWRSLLRHLVEIDWQVEVHTEAKRLPAVVDPLLKAGVKVVVDHFGRPDAAQGVNDPGFRYLLSTGASRRVWVKISGAYRNGKEGAGERTAIAAVPLLRDAFGLDRLMWASDWPHTQFEKTIDYAAMRAQLDLWLPNPQDRKVVLADTPARLFRFIPT